MSRNPFIFGAPIQNLQQFFNRDDITKRIMNRLLNMGDSSVIGERRVGKTSLLYYLQEPEIARRHGLDPNQYLFVYFNFDSAGDLSPTIFWQRLLRSLSQKISDGGLRAQIDPLLSMEKIHPFKIEDLFEAITDKGFRVVFLLDEFEAVTQATDLDADFFSHLRSLATMRFIGLIFVTSSRQKLSEMSHAGIVGSPFFNIFETFFLKPFDPESAEASITVSLAGTGASFDPQEKAYLMAISGRHPFFLQMAASYLFDAYTIYGLAGDQLRPARLERIEREFLSQAQPHFAHYWEKSTDYEKIFMAALSCLKLGSAENSTIDMESMKHAYRQADVAVHLLEDRGLVSRDSGGYQIFSQAYEQWIVQEISRPTTGRGHYKTWLEQNEPYYGGTLQALYALADNVTAHVSPKYWNLLTEWLTKSDDPAKVFALFKDAATAKAGRPVWLNFVRE